MLIVKLQVTRRGFPKYRHCHSSASWLRLKLNRIGLFSPCTFACILGNLCCAHAVLKKPRMSLLVIRHNVRHPLFYFVPYFVPASRRHLVYSHTRRTLPEKPCIPSPVKIGSRIPAWATDAVRNHPYPVSGLSRFAFDLLNRHQSPLNQCNIFVEQDAKTSEGTGL